MAKKVITLDRLAQAARLLKSEPAVLPDDIVTSSDLAGYVKAEDLNGYVKAEELESTLEQYVTADGLEAGIADGIANSGQVREALEAAAREVVSDESDTATEEEIDDLVDSLFDGSGEDDPPADDEDVSRILDSLFPD